MKKPTISPSGAATLALLLIALWPALSGAEVHMVTVMDTSFTPDELDIEVGDTVTWTNAGGTHNVDADDGSFTSGPVSSDAWVFSQTFHQGGVVTYHCDNHPVLMTGTINVEGIFGDRFESGDRSAWSTSQPVTPNCNCPGFAQHFCYFEGHPDDPDPGLFVDLSDDPCRATAAWSAVEALIAELDVAGSCAKIVAAIAFSCPDWREIFGPRCTGDGALTCVEQRIYDLGVFLGTPRSFAGDLQAIFAEP